MEQCKAQKDPNDGGYWVLVCGLKKGHHGNHKDNDTGREWQDSW